MKLKYQLFTLLLVVSAVLIALLFAFNTWSFNRGFNNYIIQSQIRSLESLASTLEDEYVTSGGWGWIMNDNSQWRRISNQSLRNSRGLERHSQGTDAAAAIAPGKERERRRLYRQMVLVDANKEMIVGRELPTQSPTWFPIVSSDVTIGYIGYEKKDRAQGNLDRIFAEQQMTNLAWVSFLMVALSALLAALFAPLIVKPVVTVSRAVAKISAGDYDQRVETLRKDEIGDLSRDVNQLAFTLDESRNARRKWLAEISHELRTPVAILQGEIEAIEDGIREFNDDSLNSLQVETVRLSRLIQDLHNLSLSDLGALEYKMSPMNMQELIRERLQSVETQRLESGIEISISPDSKRSEILGDTQRMGQLIDNLLQNSLRYTDSNGLLNIDLKTNGDTLTIVWTDSSPGLSDTDLPKLFDPLYRTEPSRNRNTGGAGLGLAIVEKIVHAHQGSVLATHSPLGGLEITLTFPVAINALKNKI